MASTILCCLILALCTSTLVTATPRYWLFPSEYFDAGPKPAQDAACLAHPDRAYGNHAGVASSTSTLFTLANSAGTKVTSLCPGTQYNVKVSLGIGSYALLTASQGTLEEARANGDTCTNRAVYDVTTISDLVDTLTNTLTLPCTATGSVTLKVTAAADQTDSFNQASSTLKIDTTCAPKSCASGTTSSTSTSATKTPTSSTTTTISPSPSTSTSAATSTEVTSLNNAMCATALQKPTGTCTASSLGYSCSGSPATAGGLKVHWTLGSCAPSNPCTATYTLRNANIGTTQTMLHMAVSYPTTGYVAVSFGSKANHMTGHDAVIGWASTGGLSVVNAYAMSGYSVSIQDVYSGDSQFMVFSGAVESGSVTTICFTRPLAFSAAKNSGALTSSKSLAMNYAYGHNNQDSLSEHQGKGGMVLDLATGTLAAAGGLNWIRIHGILLFVAWIPLAPLGIMMARHKALLGDAKVANVHLWFHLHRAVQFLAVALFAGGLAIAFTKLGDGQGGIGEAHGALGKFMIAMVVAQVVIAFIRPKPDTKHRFLWNQVHWNLGRLTAAAGISNVFVGFFLYHKEAGEKVVKWLAPAIVILGIYLVAEVVLSLRGLGKRSSEKGVLEMRQQIRKADAEQDGMDTPNSAAGNV